MREIVEVLQGACDVCGDVLSAPELESRLEVEISGYSLNEKDQSTGSERSEAGQKDLCRSCFDEITRVIRRIPASNAHQMRDAPHLKDHVVWKGCNIDEVAEIAGNRWVLECTWQRFSRDVDNRQLKIATSTGFLFVPVGATIGWHDGELYYYLPHELTEN